MKKYLLLILSIIVLPTVVLAAVFNSGQVGTAASNGYVLQTNGSLSTWVATSSLNISGGGTVGGGGTAGMVTSWLTGSTLTATGTPTVAAITATSSNATSTFAGPISLGNSLFNGQFAPSGFFGSLTKHQVTMSDNIDDGLSFFTFANTSMGNFAAGCITGDNGNTTIGGGLFSPYNMNICFTGPNWNGAINGLTGVGPNSEVNYNTDGGIVNATLSSNEASSTQNFCVGPSYLLGGCDMSLVDISHTAFPGNAYQANLGLGTTTPFARLAIVASSTTALPYFLIASSTNGMASTIGTVPQQTIFQVDKTGQIIHGNNALITNIQTGTTTISNLNMGSMSFDNDAGVVNWIDLPIVSASNNTTQSYTANVGGLPLLTIFGRSTGSAAKNLGVGIGSTTPYALLSVTNNSSGTSLASSSVEFAISSSTATLTTTHLMVDNKGNLYASSTAPTLTNATWAVVGDNGAGTINASASPATVTFANGGYTGVPTCLISEQTSSVVNALSYTVTATALTISQTALTGNVDYRCIGHAPK